MDPTAGSGLRHNFPLRLRRSSRGQISSRKMICVGPFSPQISQQRLGNPVQLRQLRRAADSLSFQNSHRRSKSLAPHTQGSIVGPCCSSSSWVGMLGKPRLDSTLRVPTEKTELSQTEARSCNVARCSLGQTSRTLQKQDGWASRDCLLDTECSLALCCTETRVWYRHSRMGLFFCN